MEELHRRYFAEDSDLHREIHAMQARHAEELRREEERGYARGLQAAQDNPLELGLQKRSVAQVLEAAELDLKLESMINAAMQAREPGGSIAIPISVDDLKDLVAAGASAGAI